MEDIEKEEKLQKERSEKLKKERIARAHFLIEREQNQQRAYTSFGKLILADEITRPIYSFGKDNRFHQPTKKQEPLPKEFWYGDYEEVEPLVIKGESDDEEEEEDDDEDEDEKKQKEEEIKKPSKCSAYYKYNVKPKWTIGKEERKPLNQGERFVYYDHPYTEENDFSKFPKKWQRTIGCAMALEPRVKYDFREKVPGPGRYDPNDKNVKHKNPSYYIGEKIDYSSALRPLNGTNRRVGPGKYNYEKWINLEDKDEDKIDKEYLCSRNEVKQINALRAKSSKPYKVNYKDLAKERNLDIRLDKHDEEKYILPEQDFIKFKREPVLSSKYRRPPQYSLGKDKRKGLFNLTWTKHETYEDYSSVGKQVRSYRRTAAEIQMGKATRDAENKRGIFSHMMDRQPVKVVIPLPKF